VLNYRSYPKNKTGYPFFWTTLYIWLSLAVVWLNVEIQKMLISTGVIVSGKELRKSEDRRKKAAYAEELKRQMQEALSIKQQ